MLNVIFIVGVIALRHLPTLLNVDVDVDEMHTATSSLYYPSRSAKFGAPTTR